MPVPVPVPVTAEEKMRLDAGGMAEQGIHLVTASILRQVRQGLPELAWLLMSNSDNLLAKLFTP